MKIIAKILMVVVILALLLLIGTTINNMNGQKQNNNINIQGPVPEGYDLEHFRKTGETIPKENIIGN